MLSRSEINKKKIKQLQKEEKNKQPSQFKKKLRNFFLIVLLLLTLTVLYAFLIEPNFLLVHEYKITDSSIPNAFHGLKVLHFSDFHYGSTTTKDDFERILTAINDTKPDIVVFTGDLVERSNSVTEQDKQVLITFLSNINYTLGKYAIWGNHDVDTNNSYKEIMTSGGFTLLENSYDFVYNKDTIPIVIYGTTLDCQLQTLSNNDDLKDLYTIVLTHEPDNIDNISSNTNAHLVLAGHSHGGQVRLPFLKPLSLPQGAKNYYDSYYHVNNVDLYVSNGIGTSTIKMRFNSVPSINLYRLTNR